jgi:hypothetical protein
MLLSIPLKQLDCKVYDEYFKLEHSGVAHHYLAILWMALEIRHQHRAQVVKQLVAQLRLFHSHHFGLRIQIQELVPWQQVAGLLELTLRRRANHDPDLKRIVLVVLQAESVVFYEKSIASGAVGVEDLAVFGNLAVAVVVKAKVHLVHLGTPPAVVVDVPKPGTVVNVHQLVRHRLSFPNHFLYLDRVSGLLVVFFRLRVVVV